MEEQIEKGIKDLVEKAATTSDAGEATSFATAALQLANVLLALSSIKKK